MRKNRILVICLTTILLIVLTGCGSQIPDMTDDERMAISEYAVSLLLKYDTNQSSRLVDLDSLDEEPEPTKTPKPVATQPPQGTGEMDKTEDTPVIELEGSSVANIGELKVALGLSDNISIEFADYQMVDKYADPSGDVAIEAKEGKKLMVCNFVLINDGAEKQSVDMLRENILYVLRIGEERFNCQITMLSNDLTTYMGILQPDESRKVVVITECYEAKVNNASVVCLEVQRNDAVAAYQIK